MTSIRSVMFCLLLAAAAPATAQVVTRAVTEQPVETTVTRYPDQTVVTQRPLPPAGTIGVVRGVAPAYATYGTVGVPDFPDIPPASETIGAPVTATPVQPPYGVRRVHTITVRAAAQPAAAMQPVAVRPAMVRRTHVARRTRVVRRTDVARRTRVVRRTAWRTRAVPARTTGAGVLRRVAATRRVSFARRARTVAARRAGRRTVRRVAARWGVGQPLVLTSAQRRTIYRSVAEQQGFAAPLSTEVVSYPAGETVVQPTAATGYSVAFPSAPAETYPPTAYASAGYPVTYTVGSVIPASVPRAVVPRSVVLRVPQARNYQYAVINNRVLLVDPATGTVMADVTP